MTKLAVNVEVEAIVKVDPSPTILLRQDMRKLRVKRKEKSEEISKLPLTLRQDESIEQKEYLRHDSFERKRLRGERNRQIQHWQSEILRDDPADVFIENTKAQTDSRRHARFFSYIHNKVGTDRDSGIGESYFVAVENSKVISEEKTGLNNNQEEQARPKDSSDHEHSNPEDFEPLEAEEDLGFDPADSEACSDIETEDSK